MILSGFWTSLFVIFITNGVVVQCGKFDEQGRKDDKLVLNPLELIDLVLEEQQRKDSISDAQPFHKPVYVTKPQMTTADIVRDEETLKARKVWSRWSKWSDCSVTCGAGVVTRRRACVAGRCASGEHEEQLRPCYRAPCPSATTNFQLDERDTD